MGLSPAPRRSEDAHTKAVEQLAQARDRQRDLIDSAEAAEGDVPARIRQQRHWKLRATRSRLARRGSCGPSAGSSHGRRHDSRAGDSPFPGASRRAATSSGAPPSWPRALTSMRSWGGSSPTTVSLRRGRRQGASRAASTVRASLRPPALQAPRSATCCRPARSPEQPLSAEVPGGPSGDRWPALPDGSADRPIAARHRCRAACGEPQVLVEPGMWCRSSPRERGGGAQFCRIDSELTPWPSGAPQLMPDHVSADSSSVMTSPALTLTVDDGPVCSLNRRLTGVPAGKREACQPGFASWPGPVRLTLDPQAPEQRTRQSIVWSPSWVPTAGSGGSGQCHHRRTPTV